MIRIKAVDPQNLLDVCRLTAAQHREAPAGEGQQKGCGCGERSCNAVSIAEAGYNPELHPNAIYSNNLLIGFFMYQRKEAQADTAAICRFMVDDRFRQKEQKAWEHILRGLKIQGVKRVVLKLDRDTEGARALALSQEFHLAGTPGEDGSPLELEL